MESNVTIIWGGTLAIVLARLQKTPFEVTNIKRDKNDQIKRMGVYYMCLDDLPL